MKEKIIIEKIPKNLGGGFTAYNEKQKYACRGDGKTEVEALQDFLENWKIFLKHRKYWIQYKKGRIHKKRTFFDSKYFKI